MPRSSRRADAPDDAEALATYLAFLDAADPARAAVLRQLQRVRKAPSAAEVARENVALTRELDRLRGLQNVWWDLVTTTPAASGWLRRRQRASRGCASPSAAPATRVAGPHRRDPRVRDCSTRGEQVFHCETPDEVARRARLGHCISVPRALGQRAMSEATSSYLGRPDPLECWADAVFKG